MSLAAVTQAGHPGLSKQEYRADVDGLRAVAILLVVLFHAFPAALSGGFIGVDVFFVISGYLISGIILGEQADGRFSFGRFYARRARRILPAMTLVAAGTLIFGWRVLWPDEYLMMARHAAGAAASIANLLMWKEGSYFEPAMANQPLLHLWSLGIEEQFYFVWPLVLVVAWRLGAPISKVIVAGLAASLLLNLEVIWLFAPRNAFYLPVTRFWELLIGAWLAWRALPASGAVRMASATAKDVASVAGLLLILSSAVLLDSSFAFPGVWAIPPTVGTALMIAAGRDSWLNRRFLAHPTMVYIGLISYPLYLWHWPMLSFGRILHGGPPVAAVRLAIVAASVAAASLTYHLVDKPIRFGAHTARRLAFVVLATVLVGGAGLLVTFNKGFPTRNADVAMIYRLFNDLDLQETAVTVPPCGSALASLGDCAISDPLAKPTAAVIGDSHARRLFMGLAPALKHRGENLLSLSCSRCVPFYGLFPSNYTYESTAARIRASLDFIATERSIRTVYIMSRGPAYTTGLGFGPADFPDQFHLIHAGHPRDTVDAKNFADGMRRTLRRLVDAGKQVVFVDAVPELDFAPRDCFSPWPRERHVPCELSAAGYRQRNAAYLALVASVLAEFPGVRQFSPAKYLCDDIRCPVIRSGQVVYLDSNHLSLWGGTFVAGFLVSATSGDPAAVARPPARP